MNVCRKSSSRSSVSRWTAPTERSGGTGLQSPVNQGHRRRPIILSPADHVPPPLPYCSSISPDPTPRVSSSPLYSSFLRLATFCSLFPASSLLCLRGRGSSQRRRASNCSFARRSGTLRRPTQGAGSPGAPVGKMGDARETERPRTQEANGEPVVNGANRVVNGDRRNFFVGSIDQGTTSTRFIFFNAAGEPVASHQMGFENQHPESG